MDLIEAYYKTAADLRREAQFLNQSAELLEQRADRMSDERAREKQPTQGTRGESQS